MYMKKNIIHSKLLSNMIRNLVYYLFTNSVIPESDQHTAGGTSMYSVCWGFKRKQDLFSHETCILVGSGQSKTTNKENIRW